MVKQWISGAIKKPGSLRSSLHVKKGEKISGKKLSQALHSKSPITRKRAVLARTLKGMSRHHGPRG